MKRISPKSRKVKLPSGKRPQLSQEHQQRIQKFRQSNTPLRDLFREDLTLHKFAPRTIARYLDAAITFVAYFNRPPQFISDDEIRAYLRYQSEKRRLKSGSMGIIHGMLKYLYTKTLREERPVLDIYRTPKDAPEKIILSQAQVAKALQYVRDIRFRTALELIYSCGLRETEALHLTVHDINRAQGLLTIHGKGSKDRMVPIADIMSRKTHHSLEIASPSGTAVPRLRTLAAQWRAAHRNTGSPDYRSNIVAGLAESRPRERLHQNDQRSYASALCRVPNYAERLWFLFFFEAVFFLFGTCILGINLVSCSLRGFSFKRKSRGEK